MLWKIRRELEGSHAFLSASKYSWLNKTRNELIESYRNSFATTIGTIAHAYAADCIRFREKLRKSDSHSVKFDLMRKGVPEWAIDIQSFYPTLMEYVNDAIGFQLDPEILLYYSDLCYGTADAIQYENGFLRIHDLKTGVTPAKIDQLVVYSALFFLDYRIEPTQSKVELRIYQGGDIDIYEPDTDEILDIMDKIVEGDKALRNAGSII